MSEWITDRLPTVEDAVHYCVLLWDDEEGVLVWSYDAVNEGQPWVPIPTPAPYVKSKRWTVCKDNNGWNIYEGDTTRYFLPTDCSDAAAQRIADAYNEELP